jgi:ribosome-associated toxin RatA of RatAB toxin-antitoxin module
MVEEKFALMPSFVSAIAQSFSRTQLQAIRRTKPLLLAGCLVMASAITVPTIRPVQAQLFNGPVDRLPVAERNALRQGQVVVTGERGRYVVRTLVTASKDVVWSVLTDYDQFAKFLPNVASSRLLQAQGNRKIVEQIDVRQVLVVKTRSRVRTENVETPKQRIDFRLLDGDLKSLQGSWQLEPVAAYPGAAPTQVLLTQTIAAEPPASAPTGVFYNIFKNALSDSATAIRAEIGRRSHQANVQNHVRR